MPEQDDTKKTMLSTNQVAERLNVSPLTVRRWRLVDQGPPWVKLPAGTVRYDPDALDTWIEGQRRG